MHKWSIVTILSLFFVGCSDGSSSPCEEACSYIYRQCNVQLVDEYGDYLYQSDCVNSCIAAGSTYTSACVLDTNCDADLIVGCFYYDPTISADCENACDYIYDSCNLYLEDTYGDALTEYECGLACMDLNRVNMEQCAINSNCDAYAAASCFQ